MKRHEAIAIADRLFAAARRRAAVAGSAEYSHASGYLEAAEAFCDLLKLSDSSLSLDPLYSRRAQAADEHLRKMESRA